MAKDESGNPMLAARILGTILVNAIPLAGVLWFDWQVFEVLFLYWFENVAIGVAHAARLAISTRTNSVAGGWSTVSFFAMHYGMFTFVHGIFVLVYFGIVSGGLMNFTGGFAVPVLGILGWQAASLLLETSATQGFKGSSPSDMMFEPYPRVFALHVGVIAGGFAIGELGAPIWALAALVVVKSISDIAIGLLFTPGTRTSPGTFTALRKPRD